MGVYTQCTVSHKTVKVHESNECKRSTVTCRVRVTRFYLRVPTLKRGAYGSTEHRGSNVAPCIRRGARSRCARLLLLLGRDVELEEDDVTVLDDVLLALGLVLARLQQGRVGVGVGVGVGGRVKGKGKSKGRVKGWGLEPEQRHLLDGLHVHLGRHPVLVVVPGSGSG